MLHPARLPLEPERPLRTFRGRLAADGHLFLWFADAPVATAAAAVLAAAGHAPARSGARVSLRLARGALDPCVLDLGGALGEEAQRVRALFVAGDESPSLDDVGRVSSLHQLHVAAQTGWLLRAFEQGRITTHFQPIVHAGDTRRVFAHEALLRARGREGQPLDPVAVLRSARDAGLLPSIDLAACRCAIREAAQLSAGGAIFVNLSPVLIAQAGRSLDATLEAVEAAGLSPGRFVLEVIEADRIDDALRLRALLDRFRDHGFRIALDDLGAGWSTLNLLHVLRPDFMKLDRELIREVHADPAKDLIASKLLEIGRGLGIRTIVEGVEQPEELAWAEDRGADFVQGYLIAAAGPATRAAVG